MKRTMRTEEQIIGISQEHEFGAKCADLCHKGGLVELAAENRTVTEATI